jgi:hypothetical protein
MSFEPAPPTDPAIREMSREEASAKLVELEQQLHPPPPIKPQDAQGARGRLELLSQDPRWSKALMNGDPTIREEFDRLVALSASGDVVADGIVEENEPIFSTTVDGALPPRVVAEVAQDLRASGLTDASIAQAVYGTPVSPQEHAAAAAMMNAKKADPTWRAALLAGDYAAKREWTLLCTILSCSIAEPK